MDHRGWISNSSLSCMLWLEYAEYTEVNRTVYEELNYIQYCLEETWSFIMYDLVSLWERQTVFRILCSRDGFVLEVRNVTQKLMKSHFLVSLKDVFLLVANTEQNTFLLSEELWHCMINFKSVSKHYIYFRKVLILLGITISFQKFHPRN